MFFENVLRDFFGIGTHSRKELTEKVAHAATGLDFEMAIAAHENWKLRLQRLFGRHVHGSFCFGANLLR